MNSNTYYFKYCLGDRLLFSWDFSRRQSIVDCIINAFKISQFGTFYEIIIHSSEGDMLMWVPESNLRTKEEDEQLHKNMTEHARFR